MNSSQSSSMQTSEKFASWAQLVTGLIGYPIICFVGILGNLLCIIVLNGAKMRNSTNVYLTGLAISDLIKLLNDFMYFPTTLFKHLGDQKSNILYATYYPYGFFISQFFASVSAWLTVSVAFERLLMVVYPGCSMGLLTINKARIEAFLVYLVLFILNIPCGLRYITVCRPVNRTNVTIPCPLNSSRYTDPSIVLDVDPTALWQNKAFRTNYSLFQSCMRSIVPLTLMICLNARIILSLHQTRANKRLNARNRVTFLLIMVVGCFIFLGAPDAVMSLMGWGYHDAGSPLRVGIREITDLMLSINSGVNFFLYVFFNSIFRENLCQLCLFCCPGSAPNWCGRFCPTLFASPTARGSTTGRPDGCTTCHQPSASQLSAKNANNTQMISVILPSQTMPPGVTVTPEYATLEDSIELLNSSKCAAHVNDVSTVGNDGGNSNASHNNNHIVDPVGAPSQNNASYPDSRTEQGEDHENIPLINVPKIAPNSNQNQSHKQNNYAYIHGTNAGYSIPTKLLVTDFE